MKEVAKPIAAGKHVPGEINWNPNPDIEFSHAVEDGSEEKLKEMVETIFRKYDTKKEGLLSLELAKPFLKRYCKDEMEMDDVGNDFLEETWFELDEDKKGHCTKEDMMTFLQTAWDVKN